MFFSPLAGIIPAEATAPALDHRRLLHVRVVREIDFVDFEEGLPALLTMVVMPFTYSITNGIGAGFVTYSFIKLVRGKGGQVRWVMYAPSRSSSTSRSPLLAMSGLAFARPSRWEEGSRSAGDRPRCE